VLHCKFLLNFELTAGCLRTVLDHFMNFFCLREIIKRPVFGPTPLTEPATE